jgi:hypothetical protein
VSNSSFSSPSLSTLEAISQPLRSFTTAATDCKNLAEKGLLAKSDQHGGGARKSGGQEVLLWANLRGGQL